MKKALILLPALALAFSALPASAATVSLVPQAVSVAPGDTVTVTISVDPAGATLAALKSEISYPTSLLTPTSFALAPTWIAMTQAGYDQMGSGIVIKSAGYPGGLANAAAFGTLVFTANAAGTAAITVTGDSAAYDTAGQNKLSGTQGSASISIGVAPAAPAGGTGAASTTAPASANASGASTGTTGTPAPRTSQGTGSASAIAANAPAQSAASSSTSTAPGLLAGGAGQTAGAANALGGLAGSFGPWWAWLLGLLALVAVGGGFWYWYNRGQDTPSAS